MSERELDKVPGKELGALLGQGWAMMLGHP